MKRRIENEILYITLGIFTTPLYYTFVNWNIEFFLIQKQYKLSNETYFYIFILGIPLSRCKCIRILFNNLNYNTRRLTLESLADISAMARTASWMQHLNEAEWREYNPQSWYFRECPWCVAGCRIFDLS